MLKRWKQSTFWRLLHSFGKYPNQSRGKKLPLQVVSLLVRSKFSFSTSISVLDADFWCTETAVQALYMRLNLNHPSNPSKEATPVLVWGGTSSVGLCTLYPLTLSLIASGQQQLIIPFLSILDAVQLLKLSGYTVLATASEKNHELLKSLGVASTYDCESFFSS